MNNPEKLSKLIPIRFMGMSWVPLIVIYWLPTYWWGYILKIILAIWILGVIKSSFSPMWEKYETLGAFVTLNTIWLTAILWIHNPSWISYVFSFLIVLGFMTKFHQIDKSNKT